MTNTTLKNKILSLLITLTMLVGMVPLSGIVAVATEGSELSNTESSAVMSVTVGETTTNYDTVSEAMNNLADGATLTLLSNVSGASESLYFYDETILDLNGFTMSGYYLTALNKMTIRDTSASGSGRLEQVAGITTLNCSTRTDSVGSFVIESGTYNVMDIHMKPTSSLTITGGTFENQVNVGANYYYYEEFTGNVSISGGRFLDGIRNGLGLILSDLLAEGYAFQLDDGSYADPMSNEIEEAFSVVTHTCASGGYRPNGENHLLVCSLCGKGDGTSAAHELGDVQTCEGYECVLCGASFGEGNDVHIGYGDNGFCNGCSVFIAELGGSFTECGNHAVTIGEKSAYFSFTPAEDGNYYFRSKSDIDPRLYLYGSDGNKIDESDDFYGLQFYLEAELTGGETYYLAIYNYSHTESDVTITINELCGEHVLGEQNCLGYLCTVCDVYYGEAGDHATDSEQTCSGYLCKWCGEYYGEKGNVHADEDNDAFCNACGAFMPVVSGTVSLGSLTVNTPYSDVGKIYFIFTPNEDGNYFFKSNIDGDPVLRIYDYEGHEIGYNDDYSGYNFYLDISLTKGETYYVCMYNLHGNYAGILTVKKVCDEHTPGEQNCLGYLCTVCGEYYGEQKHNVTSYKMYEDYHYGYCSDCDYSSGENHEFDENGNCVCGYFEHEHSFDGYEYDSVEHWTVCSLCGIDNPNGEYDNHKYNENGICECGRERLTDGIYLGAQLLRDGEYLDNEGNVSTTAPEGGYAYYKDGVLTLNNFSLTSFEENPLGNRDAIYSETDLSLVLVGNNYLKAIGDDGIYVAMSDLTVGGEGTLTIVSPEAQAVGGVYVGDGIDVNDGKLTINGGTLIIDSSDSGIEVDGELEINGGTIIIDADDDGMDVDGSITINGGNIYVESYENCIYGLDVAINGGDLVLDSDDGDEAICGYDSIEFGEDMGEQNVIYDEDYGYYVWADFEGNTIYEGSVSVSGKKVISAKTNVNYDDSLVYNGKEQKPTWEVYDWETDSLLTEGVDYTVEYLSDSTKEAGAYYAVITGIGNYTGKKLATFSIHKCTEIQIDETTEVDVMSYNSDVYSYVKFVPEVTATYVLRFTSDIALYVLLVEEGVGYTGYEWLSDDGVLIVEIELEAGKNYYFDVCNYDEEGAAEVNLEIICPGHVGGEATYTEKAICDICGEHYGEVLECPGHFGGEATYQESPICEECGLHYGDKLYCDHMCHKGGIYAIIWGIFDDIYEYLGIETECECGEKH